MCGLVGAAGKLGSNEEKMFKRLLEFDTVRGPHSTGVLFVNSSGQTDVIKRVGTPWDFYQFKAVEDKFRTFSCVMMGHNRWATQGKINNANAHPFEIDTIIGAHNGTLTTRYMLDDHTKFDVDSENLYHHMENHGVLETTPKLNGAFALTWWDKKDRSLNLVRNDQRPLYFVYADDDKTMFWASEAWMLSVAAHHCGVKLKAIQELPVGQHYRFDIPLAVIGSAKEIPKPHVTKVGLYEPPVYNGSSHGYYGGRGVDTSKDTTFPKRTPLVTPRTDSKAASNVTSIIDRHESRERAKITANNASYMEYQKCMNKNIKFVAQCAGTSSSNQEFIQCYAVDNERISVRCYPQKDGAIWKKLLTSSMVFSGMVKSFTSTGGMHLTIDLRSIMEDPAATKELAGVDDEADMVTDLSDDTPALVVGYKDELLTPAEFDKATSHGCAWCKCDVGLENAEDIVWIGADEFICHDCVEFTEVKDFINQAEGNK